MILPGGIDNNALQIKKKDQSRRHHLSEHEREAILSFYRDQYPSVQRLLDLYEAKKRLSHSSRSLSKFPELREWRPKGRKLVQDEVEVLRYVCELGAKRHLQLKLTHLRKHSSWTLRGEEFQSEKTSGPHKSSFVRLDDTFGQVQFFITHNLFGKPHHFAIVDWFGAPRLDAGSQLWVTDDVIHNRTLTPVGGLSMPLAVGWETGTFWFLNVQWVVGWVCCTQFAVFDALFGHARQATTPVWQSDAGDELWRKSESDCLDHPRYGHAFLRWKKSDEELARPLSLWIRLPQCGGQACERERTGSITRDTCGG